MTQTSQFTHITVALGIKAIEFLVSCPWSIRASNSRWGPAATEEEELRTSSSPTHVKSSSVGVDRNLLCPWTEVWCSLLRSWSVPRLPPRAQRWAQHIQAHWLHQTLSYREFLHRRPESAINMKLWADLVSPDWTRESCEWKLLLASFPRIRTSWPWPMVRYTDMHVWRLREP